MDRQTDLAIAGSSETALANLRRIADQASEFVRQSKSKNTVSAYDSDWRHFSRWCDEHGFPSLPAAPETVALYLSDLSNTHKTSTVIRRVSSISQAHQMAGFESPSKSSKVRLVIAGIKRAKGTAAVRKSPVLVPDLKRMILELPTGLIGIRDRALLLIGFCGAFRRSELVSLDHADVQVTRDGLVITLRRSKTDQEGEGRKIGVPFGSHPESCPVRALQDWLDASAITSGSLFRPINRHGRMAPARLTPKAVAGIVKRSAKRIGLDVQTVAGHSLRSGLCTSAADAGASERSIMNQSGHRSLMTVRRYIRDGSLFKKNAAAVLGL